MIVSRILTRSMLSAVGVLLAVVFTAQTAIAGGSGKGKITLPSPAAVLMQGVTERSFTGGKCSAIPSNQGLDAWVVPIGEKYFAVGADNLPRSNFGYTFYVGFYDQDCDWVRGVAALGNPTQPLNTTRTYGGRVDRASWAVVSVTAGVEVQISWLECSTSSNCIP